VRIIAKQKEAETKRMNINVPTDLHNAFKSKTAAQGLEMTVVLLEFIERYVGKNGPATPKKGRRK
jgi:predicted DNA binding CopG/RHH family protein